MSTDDSLNKFSNTKKVVLDSIPPAKVRLVKPMPRLSPNSREIKRKCRQAEQKLKRTVCWCQMKFFKKTNILLVKTEEKEKRKTSGPSFIATKCHKPRGLSKTTDATIYPPHRQLKRPPWSHSWISVNEIKLLVIKSPLTLLCTSSPLLCSIISRAFHCAPLYTISKLSLSSGPSDIMSVWFQKENAPSVLQ